MLDRLRGFQDRVGNGALPVSKSDRGSNCICSGTVSMFEKAGFNTISSLATGRIPAGICFATWRKFVVAVLVVLVLGLSGYSVSAYRELRNWIVSSSSVGSSFREFNTPSGINRSIAYDRGQVSCRIPFSDPQGNILAHGSNGDVIQVSVSWTLYRCDLKIGLFLVLLQLGKYHVSFTGYPMTLPPKC